MYEKTLGFRNDSLRLAAFAAREMLAFALTAIKDWDVCRGYLLQATMMTLLVHARSVDPSALILRWSSARENKVTTTILKRSRSASIWEAARPRARSASRAQTHKEGVQRAPPTSCVRKKGLRDSLNSLILQIFGGFLLATTLGYHEWYNWASSNKDPIRRF
jgi:hypothetical protein